jgi:hypothetical protein
MSLAGDGVADELFYLLWCKNNETRRGLAVLITDTIIYKCGQPCAW